MIAEEKDILMLQNILFKDDDKLDLSILGHPILIIGISNTHFYYLTLSSSKLRKLNEKEFNEQFYILGNLNHIRLNAKTNYVNLKNIYKEEIKNLLPLVTLNDKFYYDLINKFKYYQLNIKKDEFYDELKEISNNWKSKQTNSQNIKVKKLKK